MSFLLVIVIHSIDNVFLSVLDDFPNGTSYHVPGREGGDGQTLPLPFQHHSLVIFQLGDLLKSSIDIIQGEQSEVFDIVPGLEEDGG